MTGRLLAALAARPLLLDAGMGTRLMARGLDLAADDPALWNLSHAEDVRDIHARDVAAGSDGLLTNTFGANVAWLDRFGRSAELAAINRRAVELAREAAGAARFVLGSIGPTAADWAGAYRAQAACLVEAGVDGLMLETHTPDRALVGLAEIRGAFAGPILVGLCVAPDRDDARRLVEAGADAIGVNCVHPGDARDRLAAVAGAVAVPLLWKPGAAHPDGPTIRPDDLAAEVADLLASGVRLFGGCCGATEAHVAAMRQALDRAMADGV